MAYGLKWFSEFDDLGDTRIPGSDNVLYRVEILDRDFSGSPIEVMSAENPISIEMADVSDPFQVIRAQKVTVQWISDEESEFDISDLFITDDRKYQLAVKVYEDGSFKTIWSGYLVPVDCEEPFQSKPYPVTMSATCGLPFLRDDYFLTAFGQFTEGKMSLISILANCLTSTGLSLNINTFIDLYEQGMVFGNTSSLALSEIDTDGLRGMKAADVLEGILAAFKAFVTQSNNTWVIKGLKEQTAVNGNQRSFGPSGNSIGFSSVNQSASFGRNPYPNTPWISPTADVIERLAEPNSIVTETVRPGIPVNRLANGLFSGPVFGTVPGWNNHIGSIPWSRDGSGMPDNPYRLAFRRHIEVDPKKKKRAYNPYSYFDTGPIDLNLGDFNVDAKDRPDVKIVVAGALRMNNVLGFAMVVSINENERDYASYLDINGDWFYSKKEDKDIQVSTTQTEEKPVREYNELETQTFEVASKDITNLVKSGSQGIARLRIRIFPGIQFPKYIGNQAFLSIEDLSLIVVTDSVYEGEHKYQVDGKLPIRNANEVEFTTIIADKIGIDTPEQKREVNRVMTGYMTLTGGNTLTKGWKYPDDAGYEPIQKKALRESIRLLCGKRRVIEGTFFGYGLRPDMSIFNRYDNLGAPTKFFTQTGWKWDIKECYFSSTFHELDFSPLVDEDIYLYDDEEGRRGNRMYRGSSSGSGTGLGVKPSEEIVLADMPGVFFTVGRQEIKVFPLAKYIESSHQPEDLIAGIKHYTDWVSHVAIDRGTDGKALDIQITAWPTIPGTDRVLIELIGENGEDYLAAIDIVALPAPRVDNTLLSIGTTITEIGEIPGTYELPENRWDWLAHIKSRHDEYELIITGGGDFGTAVNRTIRAQVNDSEDAQYRIFQEMGGILTEAGVFTFTVNTYLRGELHYTESGDFVLYDEEFLAKVKFFLTKDNTSLGEISPDGVSEFVNPISWDPEVAIDDVEHDKITFILYNSTESIKTTVLELSDPETVGAYPLYGTDQELPAGAYKLEVILALGNDNVLKRYVNFTINEKEVEREGYGIKLIEAIPGKTDFKVLAELPLTGSSHVLPTNGWGLLSDAETSAYDREEFEIFQLRGGALVEINTQPYTGAPQSIQYPTSQYETPYKFFGNKTSKDIDGIHATPSTFRAIATRWLGSKVAAKLSADFSFGPAVDIEEVPISDPGSKTADYVAGAGMSEVTEDFIKRFNVNVDDATLEIFQSESPDDPDSPGLNQIQVKEGGILFEHLQDIPDMTVIGNLTGGGVPYAVTVADIMSEAEIGDLITAIAIKNYITEQLGDSEDWVTDNFVPLTRQVLAGLGLTGGGPLDIDRTVSLGTPSTLNAGTTNSVAGTTHTHEITTADLVEGSNVVFSGSGVDRLIGAGPLTINVTQVPWGIVISRPTTLAGYGITDSLTTSNITSLLTGKEDVFSKGDLIEGAGISMSGVLTDRLVGPGNVTITCTVSGIGGSGTTGYIPVFTGSTAIGNSSIQDNGSYVTFNNEVSMNADVQIFAELYASKGVIGGPGAEASAVLTVNSTTQGLLPPRMTQAQRLLIAAPEPGLLVYQTDAGSNGAGYKYYLVNQWVGIPFTTPA